MAARLKYSWLRLLALWSVFSFSLFVFAPAVGVVWYVISGPSQFDPVLLALKGQSRPPVSARFDVESIIERHGHLASAVRIGGYSFYREGISYKARSIGFNIDSPSMRNGRKKIWKKEYRGAYGATYLAQMKNGGGVRTVVIVQNVMDSGEELFRVHVQSLEPFVNLAILCIVVGALGVILLEVLHGHAPKSSGTVGSS